MAYAGGAMHRRLSWFSLPEQVLQVLPVFAGGTLVMVVARAIAGDSFPGGWMVAAPVLQALLWPLAGWVLLAPQRRPPDPDKHRPL
jgi:rod shape-determining protein MreD